jgi:hypothetical protein
MHGIGPHAIGGGYKSNLVFSNDSSMRMWLSPGPSTACTLSICVPPSSSWMHVCKPCWAGQYSNLDTPRGKGHVRESSVDPAHGCGCLETGRSAHCYGSRFIITRASLEGVLRSPSYSMDKLVLRLSSPEAPNRQHERTNLNGGAAPHECRTAPSTNNRHAHLLL